MTLTGWLCICNRCRIMKVASGGGGVVGRHDSFLVT